MHCKARERLKTNSELQNAIRRNDARFPEKNAGNPAIDVSQGPFRGILQLIGRASRLSANTIPSKQIFNFSTVRSISWRIDGDDDDDDGDDDDKI